MIPAPFAYHRATSVAEAVDLLRRHGEGARLLAGGHSLLPAMKLRRTSPHTLVDIGPCRHELGDVGASGDELVIGALVCHHDLATSATVAEQAPILAHAAAQVGDPQVRRRGTIGGSLANADPAGDLPAVVLALGATLVAEGPGGRRPIAATRFFLGPGETALRPDEVLVEVRVPRVGGARWSYQRMSRRSHAWPMVAVAAVAHPACGVALAHMGPTPLRATAVEQARAGGATAAEAALVAADGTEPPADVDATAEFRRHLARALVRRALDAIGP